MKMPQHSSLPLLSVALFSYLCGDLTCALMGRQFHDRPGTLASGLQTPGAPIGPTNPGELMTLLNSHPQAPSPPPEQTAPTNLPTLLGTMQGQGQSMAVLQNGREAVVVAVGDEFEGFTLKEVGNFEARLRDASGQELTVSMGAAANSPLPQSGPAPYKTSRELRQDIGK